ncbi:unnamed protein product [Paramecium pentaurelia]|uniref:non-specific serine/threonine protein kinase n=1 Tax=Paramecium pentaurelia TaxID=43138 RepID=A0A8S1W3L3_9CILI|nr:unnamed protein product [Paramecium pentaurelia]
MNERILISELRHPSLINMIAAFQDRENFYLVMDLLSGGEIYIFILEIIKIYSEEETSIQSSFSSFIIIAVEYLQSQDIIHIDFKPENLVFDSEGYL